MRERQIIVCVGSAGTGKTTIVKALYGAAMSRGESVSIIDPNGALGGFFPNDLDAYLWDRIAHKKSGLLVLDDADSYVPKIAGKDSPWRQIWLRNRHLKTDVLVSARRPASLDPLMLSNCDKLFVFATSRADRPGIKRLEEIAPGITIPTEPYRFIAWSPKTLTGDAQHGLVHRAGGFSLDQEGDE